MNVWFNYNVTERKRELNHTFIIIFSQLYNLKQLYPRLFPSVALC